MILKLCSNVLQKENRMYVSSAVSFCSGCIKKARFSNLNFTVKMRATLKPGTGVRNPNPEIGNPNPELRMMTERFTLGMSNK